MDRQAGGMVVSRELFSVRFTETQDRVRQTPYTTMNSQRLGYTEVITRSATW